MIVNLDLTVSRLAVVKLFDGEKVVKAKQGSDALLLINELLEEQNIKPEEIEEFKINEDPGSFTGVRIAAAIANTFNWLKKKPLITQLKY